jgi:hypothetical protein
LRRLLTNLAAVVSLAIRQPLAAAAGLIAQPCGWRRVTQIGLTSVGSKFTLAAFGLGTDFSGRDLTELTGHLRHRLDRFLRAEAGSQVRVVQRKGCCIGVPTSDGRPVYTLRVEAAPNGPSRFAPPDLCCDEHDGEAPLNFVCRTSPDLRSVDVWMQVHHAAADGLPMQEMLGRLRQCWGVAQPATFPTPEDWRPHRNPASWHRPGDRPIEHAQEFLDFAPLLDSRRRINARRAGSGLQPAAVGAALVWHLSKHPDFIGKQFAVTVDVPATPQEPRCVDIVVTRPAESGGINPFVGDFNARIAACRERRSPTRRAMQAIALLPPSRAMSLLRLNPERTRETFGTVGVSLLRQTDVFLAPMSDPGFEDGFLAIGRMDLPTVDGDRRVGAASAKGDPGKAAQLLAALRDVIAHDFCKSLID